MNPQPTRTHQADLRSGNPRTLQINPTNPRRTPVPPAMDEKPVAPIRAIGGVLARPPVASARKAHPLSFGIFEQL